LPDGKFGPVHLTHQGEIWDDTFDSFKTESYPDEIRIIKVSVELQILDIYVYDGLVNDRSHLIGPNVPN
jgi:methionine salvage enolase-phosphatase E1